MWTIASTTEMLTDAFADIGTIMALVIPAIVAVTLALLGLGYGIRAIRRYVTGRKF